MTSIHRSLAVAILAAVALHSRVDAALILQNGSFETTGSLIQSGLYQAAGWTNNSGLAINASIAPAGFEFTSAAGVTGSRYLRLVSDNPDPSATGFIVQNMGTMIAGQTYTITGDLLGGLGTILKYSVVAELTSDGSLNPATVYASETTTPIAARVVVRGGLSLTYTAQAADNGQPLYIWLRATPSAAGQSERGGIDNLVLTTTTPEPGTLGFIGLGCVSLALLRRRGARY